MAAPSSCDLSRFLEDLMPDLCGVIPPLANIIAQYAAVTPPSIISHPQFKDLQYITVSSDMIFISDYDACTCGSVFCFRMDGSFVRGIGSKGSKDGQLSPRGLCVVGDSLYVADSDNTRISVFRTDGTFDRNWSLPFNPWGITFAEGLFFLTDYDADGVHAYRPDGTLVRSFGSLAENDGSLRAPKGIAYWDHHIFVVFNHGVSVYRTDGSFVRRFGSQGSGPETFFYPWDVAVCGGHLIIADQWNHRVCVYSREGAFIRSVGSEGTADDQFQSPTGVAVTPQWVFIVNRDNQRVRVFPHSTFLK